MVVGPNAFVRNDWRVVARGINHCVSDAEAKVVRQSRKKAQDVTEKDEYASQSVSIQTVSLMLRAIKILMIMRRTNPMQES